MALVDAGEARWWEPELHRWQALRIALEDETDEEVESCLQRSLDLAAQQGANSLSLRTTLTLAQVRTRHRRRERTRALIEASLRGVRGGAETRDVREAQRLLGLTDQKTTR
jgi:hypothetical protein